MTEQLKLPQTLTYDLQPYGCVTLTDLVQGSYNGHANVTGRVIAGSETSYLCGFTHSKPATGDRTIYGIKQHELDAGHVVRIAM